MKNLFVVLVFGVFLFISCILPEDIDIEVNMVQVNGSTAFRMGNVWNDDYYVQEPDHQVKVDTFYIATHEVTCREYIRFLNENNVDSTGIFNGLILMDVEDQNFHLKYNDKFYFKSNMYIDDSLDCAMMYVTWYGAIAYCNWLSEMNELEAVYTIDGEDVIADFLKNGYRLPTEAEWEYAARSEGRRDRQWSGTDNAQEIVNYVWKGNNSNGMVHVVGTKLPNDIGLYDMSGNVCEWVWNWLEFYPTANPNYPKGPDTGTSKIIRGGSFFGSNEDCATTWRNSRGRDYSSYEIGFRVARNHIGS